MRASTLCLLGAVLALAAGCRARATPRATRVTSSGAPAPSTPGADRAALDALTAELSRAVQGAWVVVDADYAGSLQAWEIQGDRVRVHDASQRWDADERLAVVSPCRIVRTRAIGGGAFTSTVDTVARGADGLHVALAPAGGGARAGDLVVACIGDRVYAFDAHAGTCQDWDALLTVARWRSPDECRLEANAGGTTFTVQPFESGDTARLDVTRAALFSQTLGAHVAERRASYADAVERADALAHR